MKLLAILMGCLALVIVFLLGLSLGVGSQGDLELVGDTLSSWISALATVCIAILTVILANETWKLREIQIGQIESIRKDAIRPAISAMFKSAPVEFSLLNLHIKNNGAGTAHNVQFKFTDLNPEAGGAFELVEAELGKLMFLHNGIQSMGPAEEKITFALNLLELNKNDRGLIFKYVAELLISYEDREGTKYDSKVIFDFSEMHGVSQVGRDPFHQMASELAAIRSDVHLIVNGQRKIQADVFNSEDRKERRALIDARHTNEGKNSKPVKDSDSK